MGDRCQILRAVGLLEVLLRALRGLRGEIWFFVMPQCATQNVFTGFFLQVGDFPLQECLLPIACCLLLFQHGQVVAKL
jgi:hypothetical protein